MCVLRFSKASANVHRACDWVMTDLPMGSYRTAGRPESSLIFKLAVTPKLYSLCDFCPTTPTRKNFGTTR